MSPAPIPLGDVRSPGGPVPVRHRLALAVEPRDGLTGGPATGVRVGRVTPRSRAAADRARGPRPPHPAEVLRTGTGGRAVLTYDSSLRRLDDLRAPVTVRLLLDDPAGRWAPRRLDVAVRGPDEVAEAEDSGPFVPGWARRVRPWLLPGPAAPVPSGVTALRFRVVRPDSAPVPWARAELFGPFGERIGWAHGDHHGEVLLVVADAGAVPADEDQVDVVLRVYGDPQTAPPDLRDPLAALPTEAFGLVAVPVGATGPPPDDDLTRGITPPAPYRPAADQVVPLIVGRTHVLPDQTFVPRR